MALDDIEIHTCGKCGIRYGAPVTWWEERRADGATFYCPNGHPRAYTETTATKLQRELDRAKQNAAYLEERIAFAQSDAERERARRIALSGQVTKLKKRASGGVCPCCNRTFMALQKHMAQKHPGFSAEPAADSNVVKMQGSRK